MPCEISAFERHAVVTIFENSFQNTPTTSLRACMPNSRCFLVRDTDVHPILQGSSELVSFPPIAQVLSEEDQGLP